MLPLINTERKNLLNKEAKCHKYASTVSKTGMSSHRTQQAKAKQNFTWLLVVETICPRVTQATDTSICLEVMDVQDVSPVAQEYELRTNLRGCPSMQITTRCHETKGPQTSPWHLDHLWTTSLQVYISSSSAPPELQEIIHKLKVKEKVRNM